MCYDIKVSLERQLKIAKHYGDVNAINEIESKLIPLLNPIEREYYQVSGFSHPKLFLFNGKDVELAEWGLVPNWARDVESSKQIANQTLNARIESITEKPSFKDAVEKGRSILFVDGFYEHHHLNKKTFPYYIHRADSTPMAIAAIKSEWLNPISGNSLKSFSIVTTKANSLLTEIHNNPRLQEARIPVILNEDKIESWLNLPMDEAIQEVSLPIDSGLLASHTVKRFRNVSQSDKKDASEEFFYPELGPTLFD